MPCMGMFVRCYFCVVLFLCPWRLKKSQLVLVQKKPLSVGTEIVLVDWTLRPNYKDQ